MSDVYKPSVESHETSADIFDYYSVPLWMMKGYLEQLGGREVDCRGVSGSEVDCCFEGDGWQAVLSAAPWRHIGSLRVGGTRAAFTGKADLLEAFYIRLHQKTLRGGG